MKSRILIVEKTIMDYGDTIKLIGGNNMDIKTILSETTDEIIALVVTGATMIGYFVGVNVPTEPMMIVLGYYFGKKVATE